ncbi:unnamed protein product [Aspergillus oryzae]|nr:unnamed protein product [Aspergillus oryzae]GMF86940.1 unnamed protein product [Aspergillus oryzae]
MVSIECLVGLPWHHEYLVRMWYDDAGDASNCTHPDAYEEKGRLGRGVSASGRVRIPVASVALASTDLMRRVIIMIICQLVYASKTIDSPDPSHETWPVAISTQLVQSLSIVTACSPQFKPFLDSLRSTGMRLGGMTSYGHSQKGYGSYSASRARSRRGTVRSDTHELVPLPMQDTHQATVTISTPSLGWDGESQSSQAPIIHEIRTWTVTEVRRSFAENSK